MFKNRTRQALTSRNSRIIHFILHVTVYHSMNKKSYNYLTELLNFLEIDSRKLIKVGSAFILFVAFAGIGLLCLSSLIWLVAGFVFFILIALTGLRIYFLTFPRPIISPMFISDDYLVAMAEA